MYLINTVYMYTVYCIVYTVYIYIYIYIYIQYIHESWTPFWILLCTVPQGEQLQPWCGHIDKKDEEQFHCCCSTEIKPNIDKTFNI